MTCRDRKSQMGLTVSPFHSASRKRDHGGSHRMSIRWHTRSDARGYRKRNENSQAARRAISKFRCGFLSDS